MHRLLACFIALFISCNLMAQSPAPILNKEQVKADINYLVAAIENTSVNAFARISKEKFLKEIDKAEKKLLAKKQVTITDLYANLQPVVVLLEDGHTELYVNSYLEATDYEVFPLELSFSSTGITVTGLKAGYNNSISPNIIGKKISSINGHSLQDILNTINAYSSGETRNSRIALSGYIFNTIFDLFLSKGQYLNVKLSDNTSLHVNIIKKTELKDEASGTKPGTPNYSYEVNKNINTAVLTFNSFSGLNRFKGFLSEMFASLQTNHINNLVIDIRNNGGGNSDLGDELLRYIVDVPFTQYEKTVTKYSEISKASVQADLPADSKELKEYLSKQSGTMDTIVKSKDLIHPFENRFSGKVYLLTSQSTFSSAADFANAFKYYKLGKIIGEETGGFIISPGEDITTRLPNSNLEVHISSSKDFDIGASPTDWHGVRPDIMIKRDNALNYTLTKVIGQ